MILPIAGSCGFRARTMERRLCLPLLAVLLLASIAAGLPMRPQRVAPLALPVEGPAPPPAAAFPAPQQVAAAPLSALPAALVGKPEVLAARTANGATFDLGGGRYALLEDSLPLHYRDADGAYQPVSAAFVSVAGGWLNATNTLHTSVAQRTSSAKILAGDVGTGWQPIALSASSPVQSTDLATPLDAASAAPATRSRDTQTIRYPQSWSAAGVQDQWHTAPGSSEYALRLAALPMPHGLLPQLLDLRVHLHLRPGTTITAQGKPIALPFATPDGLTFTGAHGEDILLLPPVAYEQGNSGQRVTGSYELVGTADLSVVELRVRFPWRWLADPSRQFPVILDPVFQTRTPINMRSAVYDSAKTFKGYDDAAPLKLGQFKDETRRLLVRFDLPTMPPGTTLASAHLLVVPIGSTDNDVAGPQGVYTANGVAHGEFQQAQMRAYGLGNGDWTTVAPPAFDPNAPLSGSVGPDVVMTYSNGLSGGQLGSDWDVTALAQGWVGMAAWSGLIDPGATNNGVVLALKDEFCQPDSLRCGGFTIASPSIWNDDDLGATERISTPNGVFNSTSKGGGGLRLVAFYNGPALAEGQVQSINANPSADPPFYHADHEYRLPPLPGDRWQAVVVRGFGPATTSNPPDYDHPNTRPLQGSLPLQLRNSVATTLTSAATNGGAGYVVLNGAASPGAQTNLQVQSPGGTPLGYDVRLIGQQPTVIAPLLGGSQNVSYVFDSDTPLALWKVNVANGSNSRVDVTVSSNIFYDPLEKFRPLTRRFQAQLFRGTDGLALTPDKPYAALQGNGEDFYMRLASPIFSATTDQYALALNYNGPFVNVIPPPPPPNIAPDGAAVQDAAAVQRLQFSVSVQVTSCPAIDADGDPTFPTAAGTCQKVKCPTITSFPSGSPNERHSGFFDVWSASGWSSAGNPATSINANVAPMLGVGTGATVAVVGGRVTVDGNTANVNDDGSFNPPTVMLVDCGSPANASNTLNGFFSVYNGAMNGDGFDLNEDGRNASLRPNGPGASELDKIWQPQDQPDVTRQELDIQPYDARALGLVKLQRVVGNGLDSAALTFNGVNWAIGVGGWPSLSFGAFGSIGLGSGTPPVVAGLIVGLGNRFGLDVEPAGDKVTPRHITAIRASQATITQPPNLGGASKPVQVLILPRGTDPTTRLTCEDTANNLVSCIDLRAPDDTPAAPDRTWAMPDVHLNQQASMVALSTNGALQVYSADHPASPRDAVSQNFSYDTFGAKVSVTQEPCDKNGPIVTVIKGETKLTLPNVGASDPPDTAIDSSFKLCQTSLRAVKMAFKSAIGVPLGNSGLFLTGLSGEVNLLPTYTTIKFGMDFQAAEGGDGGVAKLHGDVTIDTRGLFAFQGTGNLLEGVMGVEGDLWVAWAPLDIGFKVSVKYPLNNPWLTGFARAHMWQGQGWQHRYAWLPDNGDTHVAAEISAQLTIKKGQAFSWWAIDLPPGDTNFGIDIAFGQFCTNDACTTYEWGVKGKLTILGYDVGLYFGFDHGFSFILGNDSHTLIDQANGGTDVPPTVRDASSPRDGPTTVRAAPPVVNGTALIPITINPGVENALFGLGWQAGAPQLSLITPAGIEVTAANAASYGTLSATTLSSALIGVQAPQPGQWQAKISGLSATGSEHYKFMAFTNHGAPIKPGADIALTPMQAGESGTGAYHITWKAPSGTTASTTINLYARKTRLPAELSPTNLDQDVPIVQHLPLRQGAYDWTTTGLANGTYQVYAVIDDGVNSFPVGNRDDACVVGAGLPTQRAFDPQRFPGTTIVTATGNVALNDATPPPLPAGLTLSGIDGAILVRWDAATSAKVAAYRVRWGTPVGVTHIFLANVQETRVTATSAPTLRIGGLTNGTVYGVQIAALDANGNQSGLTNFARATPDGATAPLPTTPAGFTTTQTSAASATFTWSAGAGPLPAGYRLTYTRLGRTPTSGQLDVPGTSATITGLQAGASYMVRVAALNSAGWSSDRSAPVRIVATSGVDADGDGVSDDWATAYGVHGATNDPDGDGLTNVQEFGAGTDPTQWDSDSDGFSDAEELAAKTDALNAGSFGTQLTQPRLTLTTDRLVFRTKLQTAAPVAPQTIRWSNTGGGTLALQASSSSSWIVPSIVGDTLQINLDTSHLTPGFYSGVVRLNAAPGSNPLVGSASCVRVDAWAAPPDTGFLYRLLLPLEARR